MQRIASRLDQMANHYTVVVIGSGYGGSIAASRLARAGQKVCLLERGREIIPGEFPDDQLEAAQATQFDTSAGLRGAEDALFRFSMHDDISVLTGNGLGGTSLINANVALPPESRVFDDIRWPAAIRDDRDGLLGHSMERAREMLRPQPYPDDWPRLAKLDALEQAADHMGRPFYKTPINVTFEDGINHVGVEQRACTLCGDCVTGCNYGSKNTLLMNYLPDAKRHGAEIYCNVEVRHVELEGDGVWTVHYRPVGLGRESFGAAHPFVRADVVIVSAGALGSTEILLRSRSEGLTLSDQLGESFTGNGDVLGLSYNGDVESHGVGYGSADPEGRPAVGPCITGVIDIREQPELADGIVIEEGVIPGGLSGLMPEILAIASRAVGYDTDHGLADLAAESAREVESLVRGAYHGAVDNTQIFLIMTHDDAAGRMELEEDRLSITWPGVGDQPAIHQANAALEHATQGLGGTYLRNPVWSNLVGRDLITVHPLGGCAMGEDASGGVVDAKGRVFAGAAGSGVHDGLYVADGSIIPCAVGVNPLLTISALAEQIAAQLAADRGWTIDYTPDASPMTMGETAKPGIRFTETMRGSFSQTCEEDLGELAAGRSGRLPGLVAELETIGQPFAFTLTITSDDIETMLTDPAHRARAVGTVEAPGLDGEALTVSNGSFELFSLHPEREGVQRMVYRLHLTTEAGEGYDFHGVKIIRDDPGVDTWSDTTTLYVSLRRSSDNTPAGAGVLSIATTDFLRQLRTMEVTGAEGTTERLRWLARFGRLFAGKVFETYGPVATTLSAFDPNAAPRKRREIRAGVPELYPVDIPGGVELRLSRYQGGDRGPVMLVHGLGSPSRVFSLDTIETNLLETLWASGFDVWLLDWRASVDLPTSTQQWNLDDVAADYPHVVARLLDISGADEIDVIAHCVGSISFLMALLRGMTGVRSLVSSQVALDPITARIGSWKTGLYTPEVLSALGVDSLTAYVDTDAGWQDRLFDRLLRLHPIPRDERCSSLTCRRVTFMYGLLFEHDQLNKATHDTLHEWLGVVNMEVFEHVGLMARKKHLVTADGESSDLDHIDRLAFPITFIHGAENAVFATKGTERTVERLRNANPGVAYTRHEIPEYGHQDPLIGAAAARDVYPLILRHLEMAERLSHPDPG